MRACTSSSPPQRDRTRRDAAPANPWKRAIPFAEHRLEGPAMATQDIKLEPGWRERLRGEFEQPYMSELKRFLLAERGRGRRIFPKGSEWFRALDLTPLEQVRVVILGQDPYH